MLWIGTGLFPEKRKSMQENLRKQGMPSIISFRRRQSYPEERRAESFTMALLLAISANFFPCMGWPSLLHACDDGAIVDDTEEATANGTSRI
jgi:hypothetical protein